MEIRLKNNLPIFKEAMSILVKLLELKVVLLEFTQTGLIIRSKTYNKIMYFNYWFNKGFFEDYIMPQDVLIGVPVDSLKKILTKLKKDVTIIMTDKGLTLEEGKRSFEINKQELYERENFEPPLGEGRAEMKVGNTFLDTLIKDLLALNKKSIQFKSFEGMIGIYDLYDNQYETEIPISNVVSGNYGIYNLISLQDMVTGKLSNEVKVSFGKNTPLQLTYEGENYKIRMFIAGIVRGGG